MKSIIRIFTVVVILTALCGQSAMAGNDERRGTAGAAELLINPWARSTGWGGVSINRFGKNLIGLTSNDIYSTQRATKTFANGGIVIDATGTDLSFAYTISVSNSDDSPVSDIKVTNCTLNGTTIPFVDD